MSNSQCLHGSLSELVTIQANGIATRHCSDCNTDIPEAENSEFMKSMKDLIPLRKDSTY